MDKIRWTIWTGMLFFVLAALSSGTCQAGASVNRNIGQKPSSALLSDWPYSLLNSGQNAGTTGSNTVAGGDTSGSSLVTPAVDTRFAETNGSGDISGIESGTASDIATQVSIQSTTGSLLGGLGAGLELTPSSWAIPLGLTGTYYMLTSGFGNSDIASTPELGTLAALCFVLAPSFIAFRRKKQPQPAH